MAIYTRLFNLNPKSLEIIYIMQNNNSLVKARHALEFGKKWMATNTTYTSRQTHTPSVLFYLAQVRMTRSPRLHFDHSFALHYIIYVYKLIIFG